MLTTASHSIDELIREAVQKQDEAELRRQYSAQDEFVVVNDFLPAEVLEQWESHLPSLVPQIHRNYLPGHKKGRQCRLRHGAVRRAGHSPPFITASSCSDSCGESPARR